MLEIRVAATLKPSNVASIGVGNWFGVLWFEIRTNDNVHALWVTYRTRSHLDLFWYNFYIYYLCTCLTTLCTGRSGEIQGILLDLTWVIDTPFVSINPWMCIIILIYIDQG